MHLAQTSGLSMLDLFGEKLGAGRRVIGMIMKLYGFAGLRASDSSFPIMSTLSYNFSIYLEADLLLFLSHAPKMRPIITV